MNKPTKSYKNYLESVKATPAPWLYEERPHIQIDLKGLVEYARSKGINVPELSDEEKQQFILNATIEQVNELRQHWHYSDK